MQVTPRMPPAQTNCPAATDRLRRRTAGQRQHTTIRAVHGPACDTSSQPATVLPDQRYSKLVRPADEDLLADTAGQQSASGTGQSAIADSVTEILSTPDKATARTSPSRTNSRLDLPPGQHSSFATPTCKDRCKLRSCEKSSSILPDRASAKSASGQQESYRSYPQTATPCNRQPRRAKQATRSAAARRAVEKQPPIPSRHPLNSHQPASIPAGQRTLPRGFNGTGGSSGAASGSPSYPFTSPNRVPSIQSLRACTISS